MQVNGKIRTKLTVAADIAKADAFALAKADERVKAAVEGKNLVKEIFVPGKLVNFVVK